MYEKICKKVSDQLLKVNLLDMSDQEVFEFGFERLLSQTFRFALLLVSGIILGGVIETFVFYFVFALSRKYAGGYHADTYTKCNSYYICTFIVCLLLYRYLITTGHTNYIFIAASIFITLSIIVLSPINNPNNPILEGFENKFYLLSIVTNFLLVISALIFKVINIDIWLFIILTLVASVIYMYVEIKKRGELKMNNITKKFVEKMVNLSIKNAKGTVREVSSGCIFQAKRPKSIDENYKK